MILYSHGKRKLSQEALQAGLFIKGWQLEENLCALSCSKRNARHIVVAKTEQGTPMGCLVSIPVRLSLRDLRYTTKKVLRVQEKTIVMFYVAPRFRRLGVAKAMFKHWRHKFPQDELLGLKGRRGSLDFFKNIRVSTRVNFRKTNAKKKGIFL